MRELRRVIRPGSKRLNWNSLGINDFVLKCRNVSLIPDFWGDGRMVQKLNFSLIMNLDILKKKFMYENRKDFRVLFHFHKEPKKTNFH